MKGNITLTMIKPYAVAHGFTGPILAKINEAGFRIVAMKHIQLTLQQAQAFYMVHEGQSFYERLTEFMSSGPIVAAILEKDNAVSDYRKLIGATDPSKAEEGTLRKLFGASIERNAVHGSDSDENAIIESDFFFSKLDRY
jgi:nucleoside-diphosphate kinase